MSVEEEEEERRRRRREEEEEEENGGGGGCKVALQHYHTSSRTYTNHKLQPHCLSGQSGTHPRPAKGEVTCQRNFGDQNGQLHPNQIPGGVQGSETVSHP